MTYIVVINSLGPMGSTLLAGLIEKFGFLNVPIRKLGLHQYLMGEKMLESGYMQERLAAILQEHSKLGLYGGVSVLDRDGQTAKSLTDINLVRDDLAAYRKEKFSSLQDLYNRTSEIYCKAVVYKPITVNPHRRIELTVDTHKFEPKKLHEAYARHFDKVKMIHLTRPYTGWINSLASQAFVHPHMANKIKFFPGLRYKEWKIYNQQMKKIPGLHIDFDEMFATPIEAFANKISGFLDLPTPAVDLRSEYYDLYGKSQPYNVAFKKFDDNVSFLQPGTIRYFQKHVDQDNLDSCIPAKAAWALYLKDCLLWKNRK